MIRIVSWLTFGRVIWRFWLRKSPRSPLLLNICNQNAILETEPRTRSWTMRLCTHQNRNWKKATLNISNEVSRHVLRAGRHTLLLRRRALNLGIFASSSASSSSEVFILKIQAKEDKEIIEYNSFQSNIIEGTDYTPRTDLDVLQTLLRNRYRASPRRRSYVVGRARWAVWRRGGRGSVRAAVPPGAEFRLSFSASTFKMDHINANHMKPTLSFGPFTS